MYHGPVGCSSSPHSVRKRVEGARFPFDTRVFRLTLSDELFLELFFSQDSFFSENEFFFIQSMDLALVPSRQRAES